MPHLCKATKFDIDEIFQSSFFYLVRLPTDYQHALARLTQRNAMLSCAISQKTDGRFFFLCTVCRSSALFHGDRGLRVGTVFSTA